MDLTFLPGRLRRYVMLGFTGLFFLLLTAPADAGGFAKHRDKANQEATSQKDNPDARMFLIAVIDSNDKTIGKRCKEDLDGITDEFSYVADLIDAEWMEPKIIAGDGFSKAAVEDAISHWLPGQQLTSDDIVIFYYSGHGFRDSDDVSEYPRMWLKTAQDQDVERNNLRMEEDVYDRIKKLGAGVNIVLSDCCNSTVASANVNIDNVMVPARKRDHSSKTDNAKKSGHELFMPDEPISILATAASRGELACGKNDDGGFFTAFFLDDLDYLINKDDEEATWEAIFKYADKNASYLARSAACPTTKHNEKGRCVQTAQVKIEGGIN